MKHCTAIAAIVLIAAPLGAEEKQAVLAPGEIVAAAPKADWAAIAASDLLVMELAADAKSKPRRVVIQLMPAPFSAGWIRNIRKLAAAQWWDGTSVNRVQDNYVVQWGDASEKKALPSGLEVVPESSYVANLASPVPCPVDVTDPGMCVGTSEYLLSNPIEPDRYAASGFTNGWPLGTNGSDMWPVHCYGMVGVGRDMPPNTGTGAELYTVIGHAPRHLDRNIALVGRVIEGIEHLSSLPRGTGALGFYETADERVPIRSMRIASEMETDKPLPKFEYLSTESASFAAYADARANRRDAFFIRPAGGADICNIPVPVRRAE